MCLIINKKLCPNGYKIAKKNIPCYKVLLKTYSGRFETPHIKLPVDIKTGINADEFQLEPSAAIIGRTIANVRIDKGVHSYTNLTSAQLAQDLCYRILNTDVYTGAVVLKGYIPKGTKYWVGVYSEFCSERIVLQKSNHILFSRKQ